SRETAPTVIRRAAAGARRLWAEATVALPGWLTARVVVAGVLLFSRFLYNHLHIHVGGKTLHDGLLAWDGQWYERIARHGYAAISRSAVRFFPLYPLLARTLAPVFGGMADVALLVLANAPALLFGALLVRLVRREGSDASAA